MARIRSIKPEFFRSAKIGSLSVAARLLFVGMWTEADDEGRLLGSGKQLAGAIFAFDPQATERRVNTWIAELVDAGLVAAYDVEGVRYLHIRGWKEHQRINRPTPARYPAPAPDSPRPHEHLTASLTDDSVSGSLSPHYKFNAGAGSKEQGRDQGAGSGLNNTCLESVSNVPAAVASQSRVSHEDETLNAAELRHRVHELQGVPQPDVCRFCRQGEEAIG